MKRWISIFLSILLMVQTLPLEALADTSHLILTPQELQAAIALTGLSDDAAPYHAGMRASSAMNASQAIELLDQVISHDLNGVMNTANDLLVKAAQEGIPDNHPGLVKLHAIYAEMSRLKERLNHLYDRLNTYGNYIVNNQHILTDPEFTTKDRVQYSKRVRETRDEILALLPNEVVNGEPLWRNQISLWGAMLSVKTAYAPPALENDTATEALYELIETLDAHEEPPIIERSVQVQASSVSRLDRLGGAGTAKVFVLSDDHIGLRVSGADEVKATVTDTHEPFGSETSTTKANSSSFHTKHFTVNDDGKVTVDILCQKTDYRSVFHRGVTILKGGVYGGIHMVEDDGSPYVFAANYNDEDILTGELTVYYSPLNDADQTFSIEVYAPSDVSYTARLHYVDTDNIARTAEVSGLSGHRTVSFTGKWMQIFKPGTLASEGKIYVEIESNGKTENFPLLLNVQRSFMDEPYYDSFTHRMSLIPGLGETGVKLPGSLPQGIADSMISLDLFPLDKFVPQLYIDCDGGFYLSMGSSGLNDIMFEGKAAWKSASSRKLEETRDNFEKLGSFGKKYASLFAASGDDYFRYKPRFIGNTSADMAFFLAIQGRYLRNLEDPNRTGVAKGQATAGVTFNFSAEMGFAYMPFFYGSLGMSATLGVAVTIGIEADGVWPQADALPTLSNVRLDTGTSGVTIQLRIEIAATAGIGIKNALSVSFTGYAYLNFLIFLTEETYLKIDFGGGLSYQVQILFIKWRGTIWSGETELLDTRKQKSAARAMRRNAAENTIGTSISTYNPDQEVVVHQVSQMPNAFQASKMKYAEANGKVYGFYIAPNANQRLTLHWMEMTKQSNGTVNVTATGDLTSWLATQPQQIQTALTHQYDFDVNVEHIHGKDVIFVGLLGTEAWVETTTTLADGTQITDKQPDPARCWPSFLAFYPNAQNHIEPAYTNTADYIALPSSSMGGYYASPELKVEPDSVYGSGISHMLMVVNATDENASTPQKAYQFIGYFMQDKMTNGNQNVPAYNLTSSSAGIQTDAVFTQRTTVTGNEWDFGAFYLQTLPDGTKRLAYNTILGGIITNTTDNGIVGLQTLDSGKLLSMHMLERDTDPNRVLYLKENPESTDEYMLLSASVDPQKYYPDTALYLTKATIVNYDVAIPAANFQIQTIGGCDYIYWLESIAPENPGGDVHYRVAAVIYDRYKDTVSDKLILGIFPAGEDAQQLAGKTINDLYLSEDGYACFSAYDPNDDSSTLYTFQHKLLIDAHFEGLDTEYAMIAPGEHNEILFTVSNAGNMAIRNMDMEVLVERQGASPQVIQTLHIDMAEPQNNYNVDGTQPPNQTNPDGVYRILGTNDDINGDQWLQTRHTSVFTLDGRGESDTSTLTETALLMPGGIACFKAVLRIPADWTGDNIVSIRFKGIDASQSWGGTLSDDSGKLRSIAADEPVYRLSFGENGQTVQRLGKARDGDPLAGLIKTPATIPAAVLDTVSGEDLVLDHRIYMQQGLRTVEMTVLNRSALDSDHHHAVLRTYTEDGDCVFESALGAEIVDGKVHTIVMPLAMMLGGADPKEVTVQIDVENDEDVNIMNNSFIINLRNDPLSILTHPQDAIVLEGAAAQFSVQAAGGIYPYTYQWQRRSSETAPWQDIEGATEQTLTLEGVTQGMDGWQVRCIVTDGNFDSVASAVAALSITTLPVTGDSSMPALWSALALLSLCGLALLFARRRRTNP